MIKKTLFPKVVVYRNVIDNVNDLLNVVKESQSINLNSDKPLSFIKGWSEWNVNGLMSNADVFVQNKDIILSTELGKKEYDQLKKLDEAFIQVVSDYIDEWQDVGVWQYDVKEWEFGSDLEKSDINLLMHGSNPEPRLAMSYHTDHHQYDKESPGPKHFITVTTYLNDNYEEGELSFIKEDSSEINYYKPRAGDITVFPSGEPYFHGVEPILNGKKYLSRMFVHFHYEGSKKWHSDKDKYGKDNFFYMEKDRIEEEWKSPKHYRVPVFLDDDLNDPKVKDAHGQKINIPFNKRESKEKFLITWED
jgi:hypothetical protein